MKSFRTYINEIDAAQSIPHERLAIYHLATEDLVARAILGALLMEALPSVDLGKGRSIMFHKAHVPGTQDHLHFLVKGQKFAAINKDGSAHDRSHGVQLQRWAIDGAQQHYQGFSLPKDGLIEQLYSDDATQVLTEAAGFAERISPALQLAALSEALKG